MCLGSPSIWEKSPNPGGPDRTWVRASGEEACSGQLRTAALDRGWSTEKATELNAMRNPRWDPGTEEWKKW